MSSDSDNKLAIGSIDLNAEIQAPRKSPFSYYRLFSTGNPISEFYCKLCNNTLGHIPPHKCNRCGLSIRDIGCSERMVVGFTQLTSGIMMGEYLIMTREIV